MNKLLKICHDNAGSTSRILRNVELLKRQLSYDNNDIIMTRLENIKESAIECQNQVDELYNMYKVNDGIIQKHLRKFLDNDDNTLSSAGGKFTAKHFNILNKILNGYTGDFLIFDNGGGNIFDINIDYQDYEVKNFIDYLLKNHPSWIYCYQINGEQTILKNYDNTKYKK